MACLDASLISKQEAHYGIEDLFYGSKQRRAYCSSHNLVSFSSDASGKKMQQTTLHKYFK